MMLSKWFAFRFKHRIGYVAGLLSGLLLVFLLLSDNHADWHSPGAANSGHQKLQCRDCHRPAEGHARQQIQANLKQQLGLRKHGAYFQFNPVTNGQCLDCHDRPNDRHPVQRFNEPRFAEARQNLHPEACVSCHAEHHGLRVTQSDTGFCQNCHREFSLKHDPISVPHQTLAEQRRWQTCLGCHDFHGNHKMDVPTQLDRALVPEKITAYFNGADSPYPGAIIHKAKEKPDAK
jgi:hypothetical protein